jgi:hypothetical protein
MIGPQSPASPIFIPPQAVSAANVAAEGFSAIATIEVNHIVGTHRLNPSPSSSESDFLSRGPVTSFAVKFAVDLYGAFPVKRLFWVVLRVFCSERERPFFVPSPAIRSPERAEGVKGPKR